MWSNKLLIKIFTGNVHTVIYNITIRHRVSQRKGNSIARIAFLNELFQVRARDHKIVSKNLQPVALFTQLCLCNKPHCFFQISYFFSPKSNYPIIF